MKKIFYPIAAASFLLTGCSENELIEEITPEENPGVEVLVAGFEANNPTRVAVDDNGKLTWTEGDAFFVYDATQTNTKGLLRATFSLDQGVNTAQGTFVKSAGNKISSPAYAFYPNVGDAKIDATTKKLTVSVPAKYASGAASLNMPMFCKVTDMNALKFKHLMGLLDFNFGKNLPEGYNTIIIKSTITKDGKPYAWVNKFEIADVDADADTYQFTPIGKNDSVTINNVKEGHFGLPVPDGVHIKDAHIFAQNAAQDECLLQTIINLDLKAKNVYFINRPEGTRKFVEYAGAFNSLVNANEVQKLTASGWFGMTKTGGRVEDDGSKTALKITADVNNGNSQINGGVGGYFFKEGVPANTHIYKMTFKVKRDQANLNTGFQISCRAAGNQKDFVISKNLTGLDNPAKLYTYASYSTVASAADAWDTIETYVDFDIVKCEQGSDKGKFMSSIPEEKTCFEVRIFPKGATIDKEVSIYVKDFELSEVIHPAVTIPVQK